MSPPDLPAKQLVPLVLDGKAGPGSQGRHGYLENIQRALQFSERVCKASRQRLPACWATGGLPCPARLLCSTTLAATSIGLIAQPPSHLEVFSDSAALRRARGQRPPCSALLALVCAVSILAAAPWLPLDHAAALQPRRQSVGEDADVMRRGHPWLRRAARLLLAARGSHR